MKSKLIKKLFKQNKESIYLIFEFGAIYYHMLKAIPTNGNLKEWKMFTKFTR
jgi:hypothetical protein